MGRFIVIVLDGFGVGAMPDAEIVRPRDKGANTCLSIFSKQPDLYLPTLEKLGLVNITGPISPLMNSSPQAIFGKAMLMHHGADTFFGHQEIMGTLPRKPFGEPFVNVKEKACALLCEHGFEVEEYEVGGNRLLIVNGSVTVADNIETDPGQAINVTACIDDIPFDEVLQIGRLVRTVTTVPRVIAFGGRGVHLENLLKAVEVKGEYIGVNAPASGVYNDDYHCLHMGYGVDTQVQIPVILGKQHTPVFLLGKAADVIANPFGSSISIVDTTEVLEQTLQLITENPHGFFCANVQETDLSGHRQNSEKYADRLRAADIGIAKILPSLARQDILIVMADHGNDPEIGHPQHTREMVPLMIHTSRRGPIDIGVRSTLSDVGATAADYFGAIPPENGQSFLAQIMPAAEADI